MRLFVAAELDENAAAALGSVAAALRRLATRAAPSAKLTWVPAERLHLTLRFIGDVDEHRAASIRTALAAPLAIAPFSLSFADLGVFPPKGAPRVLWVGIDRGRDQLVAAQREISQRLERCGVEREERPFSPHLTLARVRDAAGLKGRDVLAAPDRPAGIGSRVDAITLFESRLSPKGPAYTALQRTPLIGPG